MTTPITWADAHNHPPYEQRVTDADTGAEKGQKLARYDLVPVRALKALAEHFGKSCVEHGGKYEGRNWEKGVAWSLNYAAAMRHLTQWWSGENEDEEGSSHLAACMWHMAALIEYAVTHPEKDDRPVSSPDLTINDALPLPWSDTFIHTDSPTTYQDFLADAMHTAWNERQKARTADWDNDIVGGQTYDR